MKYFTYHSANNQIRLREKKNGNITFERYISKNKNIIIIGSNSSGKTRMLETLKTHAQKLYNTHIIAFKASDSLSEILYNNIEEEGKNAVASLLELELSELTINQNIRLEALKKKSENATLIIDDADKLSGKKLEITKELVRNARICILAASAESLINKTIYQKIIKNKHGVEYIDLSSSTSKDATNYLFIGFVAFIFIAGWHELALLLVAGRFAMRGMGR